MVGEAAMALSDHAVHLHQARGLGSSHQTFRAPHPDVSSAMASANGARPQVGSWERPPVVLVVTASLVTAHACVHPRLPTSKQALM
jgi:hypothetical protein